MAIVSLAVMLYLAYLVFKIIFDSLLTFKNQEISCVDVWLFLGKKTPQNSNLVTLGGLSQEATIICGCGACGPQTAPSSTCCQLFVLYFSLPEGL